MELRRHSDAIWFLSFTFCELPKPFLRWVFPFICMWDVGHYKTQHQGLQWKLLQSTGKTLPKLSMFLHKKFEGGCFVLFFSPACRLLFLKLKAQNEKEKFAFCSVKGCERIRIKAVIPKTAGVSDCEATAYPKYIETPIVEVPMPKKLSSAQLVKQLISYHRIIALVNLAHIVPTDTEKFCAGVSICCAWFSEMVQAGGIIWNRFLQRMESHCKLSTWSFGALMWCAVLERWKLQGEHWWGVRQVGPVNVILEPPAPPGCKNSSDRQGTE